MTLVASVRDFCRRHGKQHVWIALSGGLDSRVLLEACHAVRVNVPLIFHVIHVHHGLSPFADEWLASCAEICRQYDFDFHSAHVTLDADSSDSLEEMARHARYNIFAGLIQSDDLLLTAHHQDDQAETLLLQLMRGAGPKGLSAMPSIKSFAKGWHGRPLLSYSRQMLLDYATAHQLVWVDDESNADCSLTRNFLRHDILPILKSRWPTVEAALARSAMHCAEAQSLLEEVADEKLPLLVGSVHGTLSATKLLTLSEAWQRLLLRSWIGRQGHPMPDTTKLATILTSVLQSGWDKTPCVEWEGVQLRRHRDDLHLVSAKLTLAEPGQGLRPDVGAVTIRFRVPGESVEILGRGRVSLKNLFQEWRVPAWERSSLPLLFCGSKLIQVPGYFTDPAYFF